MLSSKVLSLARRLPTRVIQSRSLADDSDYAPRVEKSINHVTLLGRVGADPQKRGTEQHPVVVFSLATNTNYKYDSGDFGQKTDWHRICVFKPSLRDTIYSYLKKGQRVHVTGRLSYGEIRDEQGTARTATSIIADDVIFFQTNSAE
ncbi:single-stranded DNA-binding protein, mitochondrial [Nilaparvata lugens]|uniref:single-stranded DNA-binding protein, mitochondrial n=1 Tax=Nilaparvata lugens TaxID=108931 RepID=UPI00193DA2CD|nr:single-stranded DNA-binding protein, mitochondrial [Nilaparvata lugens]